MRDALVLCLALSFSSACGARTASRDVDAGDAGPVAAEDATSRDARPPFDARRPDAGRPPACQGQTGPGFGVTGSVPIGSFNFPFVVAGIERRGAHSCPTFFFRAGNNAEFEGDVLEITAPYSNDDVPIGPGMRDGQLTITLGAEVWEEAVTPIVERADGLFNNDLPVESWRGSLRLSHHDATSDIEGLGLDLTYCSNFPMCI